MIPYGRQEIDDSDIEAVVRALRSERITQGDLVPEFEGAIRQLVGAQYAVAVNSATSALHIACRALDVKHGDIVWTSPISFVASANCALFCGATVDFVDIDPETFNMCPVALEKKLKSAAENNKLPKVVIPVHMCGQSCDMKSIHDLSVKYGFRIIEDASHAIGGSYLNRPIGNCCHSDITVFSFHPVKIITTAEGGLATTNDQEIARRMELFRSHGVTRDPEEMTRPPDGPWYYQQIELGMNYRMTELQAALGTSQVIRLENFVASRRDLADFYDTALSELPLHLPGRNPACQSSWHLYVVRIDPQNSVLPRLEAFEKLRAAEIGVNLHYIPIHLQPYFVKNMGFREGDFPNSEAYYREAISIPMYANMAVDDRLHIVEVLSSIFR